MQTFLPYPSFRDSANCLDMKRLNNQINEAQIILYTLRMAYAKGWKHHQAVKMWQGFEPALCMYHDVCLNVWRTRGGKDGETPRSKTLFSDPCNVEMPPWLGDPSVHASHRSNLLLKDPAYYGRYGWIEPPGMPYWWPGPAYHYRSLNRVR